MADYEVGYGKPPKHTRFVKGVCPNPKGRGERKLDDAEVAPVYKFLNTQVPFLQGGERKRATRLELLIMKNVELALKGDVPSAVTLLDIHAAFPGASGGPITVVIVNGLPDSD